MKQPKKKLPIICAGLLEVQVWCDDEVSAGMFFSLDPSLWLEIPFTKSSELAEVTSLARYGYIDFIHRTARDYLEQSKQGQQFLDTNFPSNYNPHISLAEMLLTEATVLGFGEIMLGSDSVSHARHGDRLEDINANLMVYDVMNHVCLAERQGETAQVALCDDIDSTLTAINDRHGLPSPKILHEIMENISMAERQKGTARVSLCAEYENILAGINQGSSSKAHWSMRWGIIPRDFEGKAHELGKSIQRIFKRSDFVAGDDQVASLNSSSRSSSTDSFHSIDGDPILRGNSRVLPTRPVDFVGVAASWGLSRYVEQKLGSNSKTVDQDIADYLLCCSIWGFHDIDRYPPFPSHRISGLCVLIVECLRLVGDCNLYIEDFSNTLWGDFLTKVPGFISRRQSDIEKIFAMTGKAFLENGADVQVRLHREIAVRLSGLGSLDGQVVLESNRYQEFACIVEITALYALYAIQEVCGGMPEFEALEKQILNMGGSSSSKWTQIALEGFRPYKISEQQSCDLKAAFRGYGANDDENGSVQTRQKWALQIARLYKEIRGDTSDTDEPGSSNASFVWDYLWRGGSHVEAGLVLRLGGSSEVHSLQPYEI